MQLGTGIGEKMGKSSGRYAVCLVCNMLVDGRTSSASVFEGDTYDFCCENCQQTFALNPYEYVMNEVAK